MSLYTIVLLAVIAFIVFYAIMVYNSLVTVKHNVSKAWANLDVLLKQRHDELPKLVKTCEGYMQHERAVFDKLSEARGALLQAKTMPERAGAEGMLTKALGQFFAVAEAYPDLKANQSFIALQNRISEIENQIADRREFYNDTVTTFNTRILQIPDKFVAEWLNCQPADLFKVDEDDRRDVEIKFALAG